MSSLTQCKAFFGRVRTNLTSLDSQPISKAALIILLFLDLFILTSIFRGLDQHTRQLTSPDEFIPAACRDMVVDREWNPTNRVDNLSSIVLYQTMGYYVVPERKKERHPLCVPYLDLLEQIKSDKGLASAFEERSALTRESRELQQGITSLKGAYDTSLLETIAKQDEGQANVDRIRQDLQAKTERLNTLRGRIAAGEQRIEADSRVQQLWQRIQNALPADREALRAELRTRYFWFPVKRLGMQLLFLLPLLAVFYAWNSVSIRRDWGTQVLVSSHLVVVAALPVFFKLIETVYDILPKKFLAGLIELLESLKLIALWHYALIALAIAAALFLIYLFQKKLFSREKLIDRRIAKGQCQHCGRHLPPDARACPFCGSAQFRPCPQCGKPAHAHARFCRECGGSLRQGGSAAS